MDFKDVLLDLRSIEVYKKWVLFIKFNTNKSVAPHPVSYVTLGLCLKIAIHNLITAFMRCESLLLNSTLVDVKCSALSMHMAHHCSPCLADETITVHVATGTGKFNSSVIAWWLHNSPGQPGFQSYPQRNPTVFSRLA